MNSRYIEDAIEEMIRQKTELQDELQKPHSEETIQRIQRLLIRAETNYNGYVAMNEEQFPYPQ